MITPEIISYIKAERAKNIPDSTIKSSLLSNGWSESDIAEAMSSITTSGTPQPLAGNMDIKEHRKKLLWTTFFVLIGFDAVIILIMGGRGLFGVSPLSIGLRILVIYLISSFATRGSKPGENTTKTVASSIARIIGTVLLAILIIVGLFFAYCLFAFR